MSTGRHFAHERSRVVYTALTVCIIAVGLLSRSSLRELMPPVLSDYLGDTLWAMMVFTGLATVFPSRSSGQLALAAICFAVAVEISQLFQPNWLESIRRLPGMRLVLGYGFLWSDIVCYLVGVFLGWVTDRFYFRWHSVENKKTAAAKM